MTDHIDAATTELRPFIEDFVVWAESQAPDIDPDLVGTAALVHRLTVSADCGVWRRQDLEEVLLDRMPKAVENPRRAAEGTIPALAAYLTFLEETGRLRKESDLLDELLEELEDLQVDFAAALLGGRLGDFRQYEDEIAALPTIRLAPVAELAEKARQAALLLRLRSLVLWVGEHRIVGDEIPLSDSDVEQALKAVGLPVPDERPLAEAVPQLWDLWNLGVDLEFIEAVDNGVVSGDPDVAEWPYPEDDDVMDLWLLGLHSIGYADPQLDEDGLEDALGGLTRALLLQLLLFEEAAMPLAELRESLAEEVAELEGEESWEAALAFLDDPLASGLEWLRDYGMIEVDADTVRLTPLGVAGVVHLIGDDDLSIDARPAVESMTAGELLAITAQIPEHEADAEYAAWLRLRDPAGAAKELLAASTEAEDDVLLRVQAVSMVNGLGEHAEPAWRDALHIPSLRAYAATRLTQLDADDVPAPTQADTRWMLLDMWSIATGLGDHEFVTSVNEVGPPAELIALVDSLWKIPHPDVAEILDKIGETHPNKQVAKAARRAVFRTRSAAPPTP
ncbi:hypothetical protein [Rhizohabitans arisaemae]|uniref:hypothetical protein n=1 Tax=Rhizohabitans arisaemae TaxID=2720610 RepID=UPI0024B27345|nr:hypothetical protein [Rhizohabitans arisaemae]